ARVQGGVLPVRYGWGLGANLVLINPGYETRTATVRLEARDWEGYLPILARHDGGAIASTLNPSDNEATTVQLEVPAKGVVRLEVIGRVKPAQRLAQPMVFHVERRLGDTGQQVWAFRAVSAEETTLALELARDPACPVSQLTLLGKKQTFDGEEPIALTLDTTNWMIDFQSS